ncbi:Uncharacterised protein [uncultured archaeon]|nr:Uncharacterised protein [uncultured archaeon]
MAGFSGIFMIVIVIALSVAGALTLYRIADAQKECKANTDCPAENYCGSDFKCHPFPKIEIVKFDFAIPALIVGLCIVLAAMIVKKKHEPPKSFYQ